MKSKNWKEESGGEAGAESIGLIDHLLIDRYSLATEGENMLMRTLILLILTLSQFGCSVEEEGRAYTPVPLTDEVRKELEGLKREFLTIEELKVGSGSVAAWSRKVEADIEVRYTDGTVVYRGPIWMYTGLEGDVFVHNASSRAGGLSFGQEGVRLGLNGMAIGGKRRITIEPKLVRGGLLVQGPQRKNGVGVRQEKLIVEATLTAACIPRLLRFLPIGSSYFIEREIGCRDADLPKRDPSDPIWRFY